MSVLRFGPRKRLQLDTISLFSLFLSPKKSSLDPSASWLYIISQKAYELYIFRVRIRSPWYLSHQDLAKRSYTKMWAVWILFMVISSLMRPAKWLVHLMRRGWLLCPSFFISSLFNAKLPYSTFGLHRAPFNSSPRLSEVRWASSVPWPTVVV